MSPIRHTVWLTLLIAAMTAVIVLPTPASEKAVPVDWFRVRVSEADTRLKMASELYRREHSRTLARVVAAHEQPTREIFTLVRPPEIPRIYEDRIRMIAAREFGSLPRRDTSVRVVIALVVDTSASLNGVPLTDTRSSIQSVDMFPPGAIKDGVCIAIVRAHYRRLFDPTWNFDPSQWSNSFNPCAWYAAYGTPGRGVSAWLDSMRYTPIQVTEKWAVNWRPWNWQVPRTEFAGSWTGTDPSRYAIASCADGNDASCSSLMMTNIQTASQWGGEDVHLAAWVGHGRRFNVYQDYNAPALLRRLQAELGPEQFAVLWKSNESIVDAFHTVHGGSLVAWIREQARSVVPPHREHAVPSPVALVALLASIAAFLAIGTRAVARRSGFA